MVTSANELPGYRVVRNFGMVRGITVRSRSVLGNLAAGIQTIVGGNIIVLTELCEKARGRSVRTSAAARGESTERTRFWPCGMTRMR